MEAANLTLGLAFVAGLLSFISPCVLPLIPAYIGYLGGRTTLKAAGAGGDSTAVGGRFNTLVHGLFFVGGFMLVFVAFGLLLSTVVNTLALKDLIAQVGGLIVIVFGLHMMGVIGPLLQKLIGLSVWDKLGGFGAAIKGGLTRLHTALYSDTRRQMDHDADSGYFGSALMGVVFAAGWSPCIGPIYTAILALAATEGSLGRSAVLLVGYALGLGIPFLIMAVAMDQARGFLKQLRPHMHKVEIISGVLLIGIGILLLTGGLTWLSEQLGGGQFAVQVESCASALFAGEIGLGEVGECLNTPQAEPMVEVDEEVLAALAEPADFEQMDAEPLPNAQNPDDLPVGPKAGQIAPNFRVQTMFGEVVELEDLRGRPVMINFWATWCAPCRLEMPHFQAAYAAHEEDGLMILAVDNMETLGQVRAFAANNRLTIPLSLDPTGVIQQLYGVFGYPTTVFVDAEGVIQKVHPGILDAELLEEYLELIL